ncbi:MAG: hypothetical protein BRC25_00265 [Parcubacteria group bacterium SW_6_46_9]|nr:MAG: hypothetical protein BRC25_00265 [Parcubacteria group bacterium SW_6_46_9]
MPDVGPQFESSGEKKEKPEKADLGSPADDVSESVWRKEKKENELKTEKNSINTSVEFMLERDYHDGPMIERKIEIPVEETKVEFSQATQKETHGVSGYIRKRVRWDDLLKNYPDDDRAFRKQEFSDLLNEVRNSEYVSFYRRHDLEGDLLTLINAMTNDEFPNKTYNHVVGLYAGHDEKLTEQAMSEGLFMQKILDPETFLDIHPDDKGKFHGIATDMIFNKVESNELVDSIELMEETEENQKEKIRQYKDDPSVYIAGSRGLSVTRGGVWGKVGVDRQQSPIVQPMYGFGDKSKAFNTYMKKVSKIFKSKKLSGAVEKFESTRLYSSNIKKLKNSTGVGFERPDVLYRSIQDTLGEKEIDRFDTYKEPDFNHPRIPIINGHPDIPDLRWCFADYASIPTEENLNILEFISEDFEEEKAESRTESEKSE